MPQGLYYIHGIDEAKDRAKEVQPSGYFNPLLMTEGEAYLFLMRDQAKVLSEYYPDRPTYKKAVAMIDTAFRRGIRGYTPMIGAVEPSLYPIARAIDIYKERQQPAIKVAPAGVGASWQDESLIAGEILSVTEDFTPWWWAVDKKFLSAKFKTYAEYQKAANLAQAAIFKYMDNDTRQRFMDYRKQFSVQQFIIDLYNKTLENFSHHPLYSFLPQTNKYPPSVVTKNILHGAGMQSMANVGAFSTANMTLWTRNSILRKNIEVNAGALSPEMTAFALTELPDTEFSKFIGSGGVAGARIGLAVETVIAVATAIASAIGAASEFMKSIKKKKEEAFASVQGWGTEAFAANQLDWGGFTLGPGAKGGVIPSPPKDPANTKSGLTLPILAGAGLVAYLLMKK